MKVRVVVPEGCQPGHMLQIQIKDGRMVEVLIPAGSRPGMILQYSGDEVRFLGGEEGDERREKRCIKYCGQPDGIEAVVAYHGLSALCPCT